MHFSDLGMIAQALALVFALYAIASSVLGARLARPALAASGRRAVYAVAIFLVTAALALILSFVTHDFGAQYVYEHSNRVMPWYYTTAAFYGGQEGSLLYWTMMLALFSTLVVSLHRRAPAALMPYVVATLMTIDGFLLIVVNFVTTPFARFPIVPTDGLGLNPLLQDPGMLIHPPMLLMGYMSFSIPFSFAVAALITGKLDAGWLRAIRRWMLASWTIQTCGLLLGAWWAYHVLGWGGYWGWDPVENAALLPWLTATAFLHSTMVQERRGTLKVWNLALVIATFALSIFGTFEVRSGIINSVHSFAYSSIGAYFFGFLALVLVAAIGLCVYRLPKLRPEQQLDSVVSREGGFLLNNLLLTGIAFATFWGTIFPLLSATFTKQTMTVGPPFYESVNGPLFLALILLMGIGPLLAWRRASLASLVRNFRWPALIGALVALALPLLGRARVLGGCRLRGLRLRRGDHRLRAAARGACAPWARRGLRRGAGDARLAPPHALRRLPRAFRADRAGGRHHRLALLPDRARRRPRRRPERHRGRVHADLQGHHRRGQERHRGHPDDVRGQFRRSATGRCRGRSADLPELPEPADKHRLDHHAWLHRSLRLPGRLRRDEFGLDSCLRQSPRAAGLDGRHPDDSGRDRLLVAGAPTVRDVSPTRCASGEARRAGGGGRMTSSTSNLPANRPMTLANLADAGRWREALRRPATLVALAVFVALAAVWITTFVIAAQPQSLDQRVHDVASQLRCPSCNGESVADASTPVANQMRTVIREKLAAGESEQQVLADFRASYGDSILASPPPSGFTLVIWIGPALMLLAGIVVVVSAGREWRSAPAPALATEGAGEAVPVDGATRERLRAILLRELAAEEGLPFVGDSATEEGGR